MTVICIIFAVGILLVVLGVSGIIKTGRTGIPEDFEPSFSSSSQPQQEHDNLYFTNHLLHRNDKAHDRHKRNQTPL